MAHADIGEQPGLEQVLQRAIDLARVINIALAHRHIGEHGFGIDALGSLDDDAIDGATKAGSGEGAAPLRRCPLAAGRLGGGGLGA